VKFTLTIDVAEHIHDTSATAHRHVIAQMLDNAKQQVASGHAMQGDLTYGPAFGQRKIGSWELIKDAPDDPALALQEVLTGA
jgi:hypothetical protein